VNLERSINELSAKSEFDADDRAVFEEFKAALRRGEIRSAEKDADGDWHANAWVKQGILLGFKMGKMVEISKSTETFQFFDKETYPLRPTTLGDKIRIVPGGSTIRDGSYIAQNVVLMPPCYVNVGAYVEEGTMIDLDVYRRCYAEEIEAVANLRTPALIEALQNRTIYSAGLDVFANEPNVPKELIDMDHVVLFPHLGSSTEVTRAAMDQLVVDNILAWATGKPPLTPVAETPWPPKR